MKLRALPACPAQWSSYESDMEAETLLYNNVLTDRRNSTARKQEEKIWQLTDTLAIIP